MPRPPARAILDYDEFGEPIYEGDVIITLGPENEPIMAIAGRDLFGLLEELDIEIPPTESVD